MTIGRGFHTGLSLKDWSDSFSLDQEQKEILGRYAEKLLHDDLFLRVLAAMEHSVVSRWSQIPASDTEKLTECRYQLEAVRWIQKTLKALSFDEKLAMQKSSS